VAALNGLKQRESRSRIASVNYSSSEDQPALFHANNLQAQASSPMSATDREKESRWRTVGPRAVRVSLDGATNDDNDRPESQTMRLPYSSRRERRRTITEIFAGS
jgi:hypothetical protein